MANFSKSFNFRNGVQVDDDKFIVKPTTGLVGIGSTVPTQLLDVAGNIKSDGVVNSANVEVGTGITVGINSSISIDGVTGLITAVSYFGDGSTLTNVVAIATAGFTELSGTLSTTHSVGIGSTQPFDFKLDVIGDTRVVGASTFVGVTTISDLFADALGVSGVSKLTGGAIIEGGATIDQANVTGVSTFTGISTNTSLIQANGLSVAGVSTFIDDVLFRGDGIVNFGQPFGNSPRGSYVVFHGGHSTGRNMTWDGGSLIFDDMAKARFGDLGIKDMELWHSGTNANIKFDGGLEINSYGKGDVSIDSGLSVVGVSTLRSLEVSGVSTFSNSVGINTNLNVTGISTFNGAIDANAGATLNQLNVTGVSTLTGRVNANEINSATGNGLKLLHTGTEVLKTIGAGVSVFNKVTIGSLNGGASGLSTHTGELSYGLETGLSLYSRRRSLNVVNFDTGNLNYYLNASNIAFDGADLTGNFNWLKGTSNAPIMTLTGIGGSLGIGISNPTHKLEVIGTSRFAGKMILNNVDVGDIPVAKILQSASTSQNISGIFSGSHYGNIIDEKGFTILSKGTGVGSTEFTDTFFSGNVNTNAGISTMSRLRIGDSENTSGTLSVRSAALEEPSSGASPVFTVNTKESPSSIESRFRISKNGQVAIRNSGFTLGDDIGVDASAAYQIALPKITTAQRNSFTATTPGAVIYNTSDNKIQVYNGTTWKTLAYE